MRSLEIDCWHRAVLIEQRRMPPTIPERPTPLTSAFLDRTERPEQLLDVFFLTGSRDHSDEDLPLVSILDVRRLHLKRVVHAGQHDLIVQGMLCFQRFSARLVGDETAALGFAAVLVAEDVQLEDPSVRLEELTQFVLGHAARYLTAEHFDGIEMGFVKCEGRGRRHV